MLAIPRQILLTQQLYYMIAQLIQAQFQRWTGGRGQVLGLPGISNLGE